MEFTKKFQSKKNGDRVTIRYNDSEGKNCNIVFEKETDSVIIILAFKRRTAEMAHNLFRKATPLMAQQFVNCKCAIDYQNFSTEVLTQTR